MSYQLDKTDGTILTELIDGKIDQDSTNLVLVGKNYSGYGEFINENFIKLLENFSNTSAPSNPLSGQLWWDTSDERLKVFNGTVWKASGGPFVQDTRPQMVAGDLWIDNQKNQVYAYDGTDLMLMGPNYTDAQGVSGFVIDSILDLQSRSRTIAKLYVGNGLTAIISNLEFTPIFGQKIDQLITSENPEGTIFKGFNIIDTENFKFRGVAESANALVTTSGEVRTANSFLPSESNGTTTGTFTIQNSGGLTIGLSQNTVHRIIGDRYYIENQLTDHDISLRVSSSKFDALTVDSIYVDASTARVGIFNTNRLPEYTLDVEGDLRVTGNLIVEGDTTTINVETLSIEDKNIELGRVPDRTLNSNEADKAGIYIRTSDTGRKEWDWRAATNSWTSSDNIDIQGETGTYKINGVEKLKNTQLVNIEKALDLNEIGTLQYLNVSDLILESATIRSNSIITMQSQGLNITSDSDIVITNSKKITGLANPTGDQDASTKRYTDLSISIEPIVFSLDITGLGTGSQLTNSVSAYLTDLYGITENTIGKVARIHTVSYENAEVSGVDIESIKNLSFIQVDSNGTQNEVAVQDVVFDPLGAQGTVALTNVRGLMVFQSNGSEWVFQSFTTY